MDHAVSAFIIASTWYGSDHVAVAPYTAASTPATTKKILVFDGSTDVEGSAGALIIDVIVLASA